MGATKLKNVSNKTPDIISKTIKNGVVRYLQIQSSINSPYKLLLLMKIIMTMTIEIERFMYKNSL